MVLQSCNTDGGDGICLVGSGTANEYTIEPDFFNEIALYGPVNLRIRQGQEQEVRVIAEPEIYEYFSQSVESDQLQIGIKENITCFETELGVLVEITTSEIEGISVVGASQVVSSGSLDLDILVIDVIGAANVSLTGNVEKQVLDINGDVFLSNFNLLTKETRITVNGSGTMEVACDSILDINVTGAATIKYKGQPLINKNGSGAITLINSNN